MNDQEWFGLVSIGGGVKVFKIDAGRVSGLFGRERASSMGVRTLRSFDSDFRGCRLELRGARCLRTDGGEGERGGVVDDGVLSSSHSGEVAGKATDDVGCHVWLLETPSNPSSSGA